MVITAEPERLQDELPGSLGCLYPRLVGEHRARAADLHAVVHDRQAVSQRPIILPVYANPDR